MNNRAKKQWLKELRSGEWKQGIGKLMGDENEACCLGVACDIAVREGIVPPWMYSDYGDWAIDTDKKIESGVLHPDVMEWMRLDQANPTVTYTAPDGTKIKVQLSELNDGARKFVNDKEYEIPQHTFAQIANIIEEQL